MSRLLALALATLLAVPAFTFAHPGHSHKVMGTIAKVEGKKVTMTAADGKSLTFDVTARTKLTREPKTKGVFEELKAGMRAVVTLGDGDYANHADELRYSDPAATAKQ